MENTQLTNLRKAKTILEAEIDRLEKGGYSEEELIEESMQLLKNGLSCEDYLTMQQLQTQGKLDFNNFNLSAMLNATTGHSERAKEVLDYLIGRVALFLDDAVGSSDYAKTSEYSDTIFMLARIALKQ